jgi:hypothetical protein
MPVFVQVATEQEWQLHQNPRNREVTLVSNVISNLAKTAFLPKEVTSFEQIAILARLLQTAHISNNGDY